MKVTFVEEIESRTAYNRRMYCPHCGSHCYQIHHQLEPKEIENWWVECEECDWEGPGGPDRKIAIVRWKQQNEV